MGVRHFFLLDNLRDGLLFLSLVDARLAGTFAEKYHFTGLNQNDGIQ